jgi:hypothetical protein
MDKSVFNLLLERLIIILVFEYIFLILQVICLLIKLFSKSLKKILAY